jgi:uncharacterized protein (DUF1778 family)
MASQPARTTKLDIRLSAEAKARLNAAAAARDQSLSQFVLESALGRADDTLADRRLFLLDAERWDAFVAALDASPRDTQRLGRLFAEPSVFEQPPPG